jgi:hypothetical protein
VTASQVRFLGCRAIAVEDGRGRSL